ncbi:tRNA lysidine(34) synthetase TilS [Vibrio sp. ZSDE26]|uniref:tRNA(Ile)-lysidine synthase n=1 Tax=Vibrio amylolyticus TaxID=2847292 RepID=A0A9X1XI98_9VIBR|nr:tRNA lysidine(34) synthetase TilS [Vibrio amylolyticus]MCK6262605.1 tRNA lysidine(34) synthetase TilS [Vibrio amylolyticus]
MTQLLSLFSRVIEENLKANSRITLGLSGGMDSRVLLELLSQYRETAEVDCRAVYVHHGLSDNADDWATQCQRWCHRLNIPFFVEYVSLDRESGQSLEKLARDARYQALKHYIGDNDLLLTGQHSDDQIETFLLALKRGSGPKGLSSMGESLPFYSGRQVRPLLSATRQQISEFAKKQGLDWIEDESNQDSRFDRNFIRHSITPPLVERWPSFHQSVQRSAALCAEQETLLDELLSPILDAIMGEKSPLTLPPLNIASLLKQSVLAQQHLIRMWFERCGFLMPSRQHLELIIEQIIGAQQDANPQLNVAGGQVRRFNQYLYLIRKMADITAWKGRLKTNEPLLLPDGLGELIICEPHLEKSSQSTDLKECSHSISIRSVSGDLDVIFEPQGLSAHPVSRNHSRKLKKLFQEYSVPSWQRRRIPILMNENRVVAVLGLFVDKEYQGQDCEVMWNNHSDFVYN